MQPHLPLSEKNALRALARQRRAALPADLRAAHSAAICGRIAATRAFDAARCVLAYSSFGDEVATAPLIEAILAAGKTLLLPRIDQASGTLVLHAVADPGRDLRPGPWGIGEPDPARCPLAEVAAADLIAVPGVAFAPDGSRIGYGKGFYDRLLPGARRQPAAVLVALAFEIQIFPALPAEPHDLPVDLIASESRLIACRARA